MQLRPLVEEPAKVMNFSDIVQKENLRHGSLQQVEELPLIKQEIVRHKSTGFGPAVKPAG